MLLRAQFRRFVAQQLKAVGTAAGDKVYENRALPADAAGLPIIVLTTPSERKQSFGPGAPKFTTVIDLAVDAQIDGTREDVADRLELFVEQIEMAILANAAVVRLIQEFGLVESSMTINETGAKPIGTARLVFSVAIPQTYDPAMPDRLNEIDVSRQADGADPLLKITFPAP